MTTIEKSILMGLVGLLFTTGCGPTFDPGSLIKNARVVGARTEVDGAPDRATPMPGETADVTWLITAPDPIPPLAWSFAVCAPRGAGRSGAASCSDVLVRFDGNASPPRIAVPVPPGAELRDATSLVVYGQICFGDGAAPTFDPSSGMPSCTGGRGTTVSFDLPLQVGAEANHNPVAERAFTLDGEPWPSPRVGDDPCAFGPKVAAGSADHVIANRTDAGDRESYTALIGDPPVPMAVRERLQISQFTTAGELASQFSFVEAADDRREAPVEVKWAAPPVAEVPPEGRAVTFTFVTRDDRGGADWTARSLCVTP